MKLHQRRIDKLLAYIADGMTIENACYASGICRKTYYLWYEQGKKDEESGTASLQQQLYDGIPQAQALGELTHLRIIKEASKKHWKASAWFLEHTRPERYALRRPLPVNDAEERGKDTIRYIR
jgi:hypothetical protein